MLWPRCHDMARPTHIFDIFHKLWPKQGPRYILCVPTTILGVAEAGEMAISFKSN